MGFLKYQWVDQGNTPWSSPAIALVAGNYYDLEMDFFENGGDAVAQLSWTQPGQGSQLIPTARLTPPQSPWNLWREVEFNAAERLDPLVSGEDRQGIGHAATLSATGRGLIGYRAEDATRRDDHERRGPRQPAAGGPPLPAAG